MQETKNIKNFVISSLELNITFFDKINKYLFFKDILF